MDFTFEEIDILIDKGWLSKDQENIFGIKHALKSSNQGFGTQWLNKFENGEILYSYSLPTNVDPDDGSYDMKSGNRYYKNFKDYTNNTPYKIE